MCVCEPVGVVRFTVGIDYFAHSGSFCRRQKFGVRYVFLQWFVYLSVDEFPSNFV